MSWDCIIIDPTAQHHGMTADVTESPSSNASQQSPMHKSKLSLHHLEGNSNASFIYPSQARASMSTMSKQNESAVQPRIASTRALRSERRKVTVATATASNQSKSKELPPTDSSLGSEHSRGVSEPLFKCVSTMTTAVHVMVQSEWERTTSKLLEQERLVRSLQSKHAEAEERSAVMDCR